MGVTDEEVQSRRRAAPPEVVQHEVSVSLGIVGHNRWGTHDKTLL
jgi:hypothetical protein